MRTREELLMELVQISVHGAEDHTGAVNGIERLLEKEVAQSDPNAQWVIAFYARPIPR